MVKTGSVRGIDRQTIWLLLLWKMYDKWWGPQTRIRAGWCGRGEGAASLSILSLWPSLRLSSRKEIESLHGIDKLISSSIHSFCKVQPLVPHSHTTKITVTIVQFVPTCLKNPVYWLYVTTDHVCVSVWGTFIKPSSNIFMSICDTVGKLNISFHWCGNYKEHCMVIYKSRGGTLKS